MNILLPGAAGFIGSHLADRLLAAGHCVAGIDNFTRGHLGNLDAALSHPRFRFFEADLTDPAAYRRSIEAAGWKFDAVWHMAANSDISAGVADPSVDLRDTFLTTFHTLAIMRESQIPRLAFASTSAIYGKHDCALTENTGPLFPISNYGAMKLASEALISAAVESFLERAWIFRFPNVIGPRATHGIIYDLIHKLRRNREELEVLGDGTQQKPYLHVSELLDAMLFIAVNANEPLNCFNIGATDEGATVRFIAETVLAAAAPGARIRYTGGNRGWVGDVPRFYYSIEKLAALGWRPTYGSQQAVVRAVSEIYREICQGSGE